MNMKEVQQVERLHRAGAQVGIAEGLHDGRHRVEPDEPLVLLRDGGDRVDHRGGVHQQGNAKPHQEAQVAVLGGHRGDEDTEAQSQTSHHEHQQRGDQHPGVGLHVGAAQGKKCQEEQEEGKLDGEGDQVGNQDRDRHCQAREIDFAKQVGIIDRKCWRSC